MNRNDRPSFTSLTLVPKTTEQLIALAQILLGVAYADGTYDDEERDAIEFLIADYGNLDLEAVQLPVEVISHMLAFDPDTFDVFDAVVRLHLAGKTDSREVLRLVMRMVDADAVRDTSEESYFFNLAKALGLSDEAFDIMLGIDDDD